MTEADSLDRVRLSLARHATGAPEPATPECLDDDTIAALAEGALDASARAAAVPHLAECSRCRAAVASVARALSDPAVAREIAGARGGWRRWSRIAAIALPAAAAIVLLLARPRAPDDTTSIHRAPTITAGSTPSPQSPVGRVSEARTFRWIAVTDADRYRVTLFGAGGRVVYETELADTEAALPDSVTLAPGQAYLWKVEARTGFDRWSASELVQFSVVRDSGR